MSKLIKLIITLLTTLLFLTACSSSSNTSENPTTTEDKLNSTLKEKINNKQQYVVIQKDVDFDLHGDKSQIYIEETSNYMNSKNYELTHQNITFRDSGIPKHIILTFKYKGD